MLVLSVLCCAFAAPMLPVSSEEQKLEGFVDNVKELFSRLKDMGKVRLCTFSKLKNLQIQLLTISVRYSCSPIHHYFLFPAKKKGLEYVCSAQISVLMDLMGVPDELDGALSLVQQVRFHDNFNEFSSDE